MATYIKPEAIKDSSLPIEKIDNVALDLADKVNALDDNGKNTFLNKIGLGKIGVISQKQNWTSDYSSYTISDVVRGIIPLHIINAWNNLNTDWNVSRDFYLPKFSYNEETGYFECDDLTDITLNDAIAIMYYGNRALYRPIQEGYSRCRLIFAADFPTWVSSNYLGILNNTTEKVLFAGWVGANRCYKIINNEGLGGKLVREIKYLNLHDVDNKNINLPNLIIFLGVELRKNIRFSNCKRLSNESILFLIEHEVATSPITITLHADAYARAMANAEILAALETHTNVSLASA